jgi:Putative Flp pilus-assembly TadE/G-like
MGFLFDFGTMEPCRDAADNVELIDLEELSVKRRGLRFALLHMGPPVRAANARPATEIPPQITTMKRQSHPCERFSPSRERSVSWARNKSEKGQAIVVMAFALVGLLAFMALAVDVGFLRYEKRLLQTAADAAAIAGAAELSYGDVTSAADSDSAANGFTNGSNGVTVAVNNPPLSGPHVSDSNYVEAIVSRTAPTFFAKAFGVSSTQITARAVAHLGSSSNCIYALAPSGGSALEVVTNATLNSQCGIVVESSAGGALACNAPATLTAPSVGVVGTVVGGCTLPSNTTTGIAVPTPSDPLAYLPKPTVGACTFSGQKIYTSATSTKTAPSVLNPGVYCGGIQIKSGAYVVFNPGVYILTSSKSPGGLNIDIGSYVSTNTSISPYGITFYNYGPAGSITFTLTNYISGESMSLIAPTTGTYQGIIFFQDPGDTATALIVGWNSDNTDVQGAYYFPTALLEIASAGNVSYNPIVAYTVLFYDTTYNGQNFATTNIYSNYSSLSEGSPVNGGGVLAE